MHLLLASAKKKMKVKIETKPRYLDRPAGRSRGSPPADHHPSEGWGSWAPGMLPAGRWDLLSGVVGWEAGSVHSRLEEGFLETELCCLLITVLWEFLVKENK